MNTYEQGQNFNDQEKNNLDFLMKEKLIYQMLTENTGKALGDSGDIYGRHWETNQNKTLQDFQNEPSVTFAISKPENKNNKTIQPMKLEDIDYKISVFHYLQDSHFELDALCNYFNTRFVPAKNWEGEEAYGLSSAGEKWLKNWGFEFQHIFNTSNGTDFLSQVLQGCVLTLSVSQRSKSGEFSRLLSTHNYVLLQVHQGCDVRGGYTDARLFYLPDGYLPCQCVHGFVKGCEFNNWEDEKTLQFINEEPEEITEEDAINMFYSVC